VSGVLASRSTASSGKGSGSQSGVSSVFSTQSLSSTWPFPSGSRP
jgi:hypothetical protein